MPGAPAPPQGWPRPAMGYQPPGIGPMQPQAPVGFSPQQGPMPTGFPRPGFNPQNQGAPPPGAQPPGGAGPPQPPMPPQPPGMGGGAPPGAAAGPSGAGGMPVQQVPGGPPQGFDWRQMIKQVFDANPGIDPKVAAGAVTKMLPFMSAASRQEWMMAHNQFLEQQLNAKTMTAMRGQDMRLQGQEDSIDARIATAAAQRDWKTVERLGAEAAKSGLQGQRDDAAGQRQGERITAQGERQDKAIASREKLAAMKASGNPYAKAFKEDGSPLLSESALDKALAIYQYREPPILPSRGGKLDPGADAVMQIVRDIGNKSGEPYDATGYNARQRGEIAFTSGKQAQTIQSIGVAQNHLGTLVELGKALDNGDIPLANQIANAWATANGKPAPNNVRVAAQVIAGEVVKAVSSAGGGVKERLEAADKIDPKMTEEQIVGAANTWSKLLDGQIEGFKNTWGRIPGNKGKDFNKQFGIESKTYTKDGAKPAPKPGEAAPAGDKPAPPAKGEVRDGFRFKGGDPGKKESWEPVAVEVK